jgi:hypothetical protein
MAGDVEEPGGAAGIGDAAGGGRRIGGYVDDRQLHGGSLPMSYQIRRVYAFCGRPDLRIADPADEGRQGFSRLA